MNNKPYTQTEFLNKMKKINPNIIIVGEYVSSHSKISVKCKKCGYEWEARPYALIQGRGCPECGKLLAVKNRKGKTAKKTTKQFKQELSVINKDITVIGEYTGNRNKVECSCNICGHKWEANPYSLLKGMGCPCCAKIKRQNYRRYTPESFKEKVFNINPDIELLTDFKKSTETIAVKCKICGYEWSPKACSLIQGRGCPKCSHKKGAINNSGKTGLKSLSDFIDELEQKDNSIEIMGEYVNTHTNIRCKCKRCNHIWEAKPYSLLQGHGCPRCAKSGTSFMEQLILLSFRKILDDTEVISRDKSLIGMELDIVIPKYQLAIEPGNWWLHKKSLKRDKQKRVLCNEKSYQLITIYDNYPEGKEKPFDDDCYIFTGDLNIMDHTVIHSLIYELFSECKIETRFSDIEWKALEELAYNNSKAMTHDDFVSRLSKVRPDIEVIGRYENANRRIEVKCKKCGFIWNGIPASLLEGDGCRKCGAKMRGAKQRKSQKEFENELYQCLPSIKVVGTYIGRHTPVRVQCLNCGTIWEATPGSLLRKKNEDKQSSNGCPMCAKNRHGNANKKRVINIDTGEIFESAIEASKKYGTVPSAIRQCCRGISQTSNGYHWKYID